MMGYELQGAMVIYKGLRRVPVAGSSGHHLLLELRLSDEMDACASPCRIPLRPTLPLRTSAGADSTGPRTAATARYAMRGHIPG